jgi:hypothetical protein
MNISRTWLRKSVVTMAILSGFWAAIEVSAHTAESKVATVSSGYEEVFSVPIGPGSIEYSPEQGESLRWGPKALAVAPDGTFVIANTFANTLLRYDATGNLLQTIDTSTIAQGILDVKVTNAGIFALDGAAPVPTVLHFNPQGKLVAKHEVPPGLWDSLTGLVLSENGKLLLEADTKVKHQLLDSTGKRAEKAIPGLTAAGRLLTVQSPDWSKGADRSRGGINVGSKRIDISVRNVLASPRLLEGTSRNSFFALIDELMTGEDGTLKIDQVVRHYDVDGALLGMARFPLMEQFTPVDHPIAVGRDGSVYALLTKVDNVAVVRLSFSSTLSSVLPVQRHVREAVVGKDQSISARIHSRGQVIALSACTIHRNTIGNNAAGYTGNSKSLNSTNTDGPCTGRGKPRYITGSGSYVNVAYDWGGNDNVSEYNTKMDQNYKAGDIDTINPTNSTVGSPGTENCSAGTDCSGLVSRSWGKPASPKYGTTTLSEISVSAGNSWDTKKGDAMNKVGSHTRLINTQDSTGAYAWESTTDGGVDRVIYRKLAWTNYANYEARRFSDVCDP